MNDRVRLLLFTISRNSLYRDFLIVKGAGICSLYHEIHYIEIRYIEVWVYQKMLSYTAFRKYSHTDCNITKCTYLHIFWLNQCISRFFSSIYFIFLILCVFRKYSFRKYVLNFSDSIYWVKKQYCINTFPCFINTFRAQSFILLISKWKNCFVKNVDF